MAAGRRLLEEARARAAAAREWQVVRLVQDSLDYAQGRITRYDVEERYRLFQDGARDEHDRDFAGAMTHTVHQWLVDAGREYLVGHPGAGAAEFLAHFAARGRTPCAWRYRGPARSLPDSSWAGRAGAVAGADPQGRPDRRGDPAAQARRIVTSPQVPALLTADHQGRLLLQAAELQRRAGSLRALRTVVEDRAATDADTRR
ncbi:hypothetical protein ACWDUC_02585 [Streptomyces tricolor]